MIMSKGRKGKSKLSLCWSCERAGRTSCEWFSDGKPVEGWKAIPTTVLMAEAEELRAFSFGSARSSSRITQGENVR